MGLFERAGRNVERFRQEALAAARADAYRCRACDGTFHVERETCPACGSASVEPTST